MTLLPLLSVTVTVKLNDSEAVGTPERPPALFKATPAGSAPAVTAYV
jgi:hypothetical protein